jgi:hypothetical protein
MKIVRAVGSFGYAVMSAQLCLACAHGERRPDTASVAPSRAEVAASGAPAPASSVPLAPMPRDACQWIPADDVRTIVGAFAEAPRVSDGGCLYTLVVPGSVLAERAQMARIRAAIKAPPIEYPPYAVRLDVQVGSTAGGERAIGIAARTMTSWLSSGAHDSAGGTNAQPSAPAAPRDSGWDVARGIGGRRGVSLPRVVGPRRSA